jgi:predicted PurR-regulated permease PerM
MFRIALLLFSMIATTLAGSAIVVALTMGYDTLVPVLAAAAIGFVAAIPVTWALARRIAGRV